jgi:hypothetical protein
MSVDSSEIILSDDNALGDLPESTLLMHVIYATDSSHSWRFLRSFLINSGITALVLPLIGLKNPIFSSSLAVSFIVLPGKEFFIILGIAFLSQTKALIDRQRYLSALPALAVAILLTLISRPGLVLLETAALGLVYFWQRRYTHIFCASLLLLLVVAIFGASYAGRSLPGSGFEVEASIGIVQLLRDSTSGIFLIPTLERCLIYFSYLVFLPIAELYRLSSELPTVGVMPYDVFFLAASIEWVKWIRSSARRVDIAAYVLVSAFLVAISFSFLHTRYLFPILVVILILNPPVPIFHASSLSRKFKSA